MKKAFILHFALILLIASLGGCDNSGPSGFLPPGDGETAAVESGGTGSDTETVPGMAGPGETGEIYPGKKPVILVPGWAGTQAFLYDLIHYFWQISGPMEAAGFSVYEAPISCFDNHPNRSKQLAAYVYLLLKKEMAEKDISDPTVIKFNLIAHSQGGLIARYLIRGINIPDPRYDLPCPDDDSFDDITAAQLNALKDYMTDDIDIDGAEGADPAASIPKIPASEFIGNIAMLSVPHKGTYIAKWIVDDSGPLISGAATWIFENIWAGAIAGQPNTDFTAATSTMTEEYMTGVFNPTVLAQGRKTPDIKIFNYSYSVCGTNLTINALMILPLWSINYLGVYNEVQFNDNDGVVMTDSASWTPSAEDQEGNSPWTYMGNNVGYNPPWYRLIRPGVDHWMLVNQFLNLENTALGIDMTPDLDTPQLYIDIAEMLENASGGQ